MKLIILGGLLLSLIATNASEFKNNRVEFLDSRNRVTSIANLQQVVKRREGYLHYLVLSTDSTHANQKTVELEFIYHGEQIPEFLQRLRRGGYRIRVRTNRLPDRLRSWENEWELFDDAPVFADATADVSMEKLKRFTLTPSTNHRLGIPHRVRIFSRNIPTGILLGVKKNGNTGVYPPGWTHKNGNTGPYSPGWTHFLTKTRNEADQIARLIRFFPGTLYFIPFQTGSGGETKVDRIVVATSLTDIRRNTLMTIIPNFVRLGEP